MAVATVDGDDWNGGYYAAPPVVYGSPYGYGYYGSPYYAPPVVYGPGVGISLAGGQHRHSLSLRYPQRQRPASLPAVSLGACWILAISPRLRRGARC